MNRRDIPNLIGKSVRLKNLKTASLNGQYGLVKNWNKKKERFVVQTPPNENGKLVLMKPINLDYCPMPQNQKENHLRQSIGSRKLFDLDFKNVLKMFEQLGCEHRHVFWKLLWIRIYLNTKLASGDKRHVTILREELEDIIENSPFQDLIVRAKLCLGITLVYIESGEPFKSEIFDLCVSCVDANYGLLPAVFESLARIHVPFSTKLKPLQVKALKNMYHGSKLMIENGTCACESELSFIKGAVPFFKIWMDHKPSKKLFKEIFFLRKTIEDFRRVTVHFKAHKPFLIYAIANCDFWGKKYEDALKNINVFQKHLTSTGGHRCGIMREIYLLKTQIFIKLENKKKAKEAWKKLKRFGLHFVGETIIDELHSQIRDMSDYQDSTGSAEEKQYVRTRTKCSAYDCQKIKKIWLTFCW